MVRTATDENTREQLTFSLFKKTKILEFIKSNSNERTPPPPEPPTPIELLVNPKQIDFTQPRVVQKIQTQTFQRFVVQDWGADLMTLTIRGQTGKLLPTLTASRSRRMTRSERRERDSAGDDANATRRENRQNRRAARRDRREASAQQLAASQGRDSPNRNDRRAARNLDNTITEEGKPSIWAKLTEMDMAQRLAGQEQEGTTNSSPESSDQAERGPIQGAYQSLRGRISRGARRGHPDSPYKLLTRMKYSDVIGESETFQTFQALYFLYRDYDATEDILQLAYGPNLFRGYFQDFSYIQASESPWNWEYTAAFVILADLTNAEITVTQSLIERTAHLTEYKVAPAPAPRSP